MKSPKVNSRPGIARSSCGRRRDLQVDPGGRATLVELAGGVQEPRPPAERGGSFGVPGQPGPHVGQGRVGDPVEVGHHRRRSRARGRAGRTAPSARRGTVVARPEPVATQRADLDRAVGGGRGLGVADSLVQQRASGLLGALDVGLVERVDAEQPAGGGGGHLPQRAAGRRGCR